MGCSASSQRIAPASCRPPQQQVDDDSFAQQPSLSDFELTQRQDGLRQPQLLRPRESMKDTVDRLMVSNSLVKSKDQRKLEKKSS